MKLSQIILHDLKCMRRSFLSLMATVFLALMFTSVGALVFQSAFNPDLGIENAQKYIHINGLFDSGDGLKTMTSNVTLNDIKSELNATHFTRILSWGPHTIEHQGKKQTIFASFVDSNFLSMFAKSKKREMFSGLDSNEVIVSSKAHREFFNSDPNLIGQSIIVDGQPFTVIDVLIEPMNLPGFSGSEESGLFMPLHKAAGFKKDSASFLTANLSAFVMTEGLPVDSVKQKIGKIANASFKTHHSWGPNFKFGIKLETFKEFNKRRGGDHASRLSAGLAFIALIVVVNLSILLVSLIRRLSFYWATYISLGVSPASITLHFTGLLFIIFSLTAAAASVILYFSVPIMKSSIVKILPTAEQISFNIYTLMPGGVILLGLLLLAYFMSRKSLSVNAINTIVREGEQYSRHITKNAFLTASLASLIIVVSPAISVVSSNLLSVSSELSKKTPFDPNGINTVTLKHTNNRIKGDALLLAAREALRELNVSKYTLSSSPLISSYSEFKEVKDEYGELLYQARHVLIDEHFSSIFEWPSVDINENQYLSNHRIQKSVLLDNKTLSAGADMFSFGINNLPNQNTIIYLLESEQMEGLTSVSISTRGVSLAELFKDNLDFVIVENVDMVELISAAQRPHLINLILLILMTAFLITITVVGMKGYIYLSQHQKKAEINIFKECGATPVRTFMLYYDQIISAFVISLLVISFFALVASFYLPIAELRNNISPIALLSSFFIVFLLLLALTLRDAIHTCTSRYLNRRG